VLRGTQGALSVVQRTVGGRQGSSARTAGAFAPRNVVKVLIRGVVGRCAAFAARRTRVSVLAAVRKHRKAHRGQTVGFSVLYSLRLTAYGLTNDHCRLDV
jgi:hypothetical protein